jgi:hypothetical protein
VSEAVKIALIVAAAPTIAAVAALVMGILADRRSAGKLDVIHDLTNSTLAAARAEIVEAKRRIAELEQRSGGSA